jgi:hypothetical protein
MPIMTMNTRPRLNFAVALDHELPWIGAPESRVTHQQPRASRSEPGGRVIIENGVKHLGVFWLKDPDTKDQALDLIAQLGDLPQVRSVVGGGPIDHDWPAMKIDKSWDVACDVWLKDIDNCRDYFNDPEHQRIAKQLVELSERVFAIYIDY